jgi:hypothetical protein
VSLPLRRREGGKATLEISGYGVSIPLRRREGGKATLEIPGLTEYSIKKGMGKGNTKNTMIERVFY